MKQIKSYMFEAGDTLYYVDKQGEVYSFEVTEDMLEQKYKIINFQIAQQLEILILVL